VVARPRLIERLDEGLYRKLTAISAPAGFGKTTLLSAWAAGCEPQVAWLSLDDADNDQTRFLNYVVAALRTVAPTIGEAVLIALRSPQPPPTEALFTNLLNEIASVSDSFVLVIDDYHVIDARPVDDAVTFVLEHLPPQIRLIIATREDPQLPLARLRGRGQLSELRVADLRFSPSEAAEFLNQAMGLRLSAQDVAFGYFGARIMDAVFVAIMALFILFQIPLASEYVKAGASDTSYLQSLSSLFTQAQLYAYHFGMLTVGFAGLMLNYLFYRAQLVPRVLGI